jgi:hypothetical protein
MRAAACAAALIAQAPGPVSRSWKQEAIGLIFSYVFGAWASYASGDQPDAEAMPAFPPSPDGLDLAAVVTPEAAEVV